MLSNAALVTGHTTGLTGLTASTTYYYVIESKDALNNTALSATQACDDDLTLRSLERAKSRTMAGFCYAQNPVEKRKKARTVIYSI